MFHWFSLISRQFLWLFWWNFMFPFGFHVILRNFHWIFWVSIFFWNAFNLFHMFFRMLCFIAFHSFLASVRDDFAWFFMFLFGFCVIFVRFSSALLVFYHFWMYYLFNMNFPILVFFFCLCCMFYSRFFGSIIIYSLF